MLAKNTAGQYAVIYVHDTLADIPKTGYAASLTGYISKDGGTLDATDDVAPTELAYGFYQFTLTQAETNANEIIVTAIPASTQFSVQAFKYSTDNVVLAADGLNAINNTEITAVPSDFREKLMWLFQRFFNKQLKTSTQIQQCKDDDTVITKQNYTVAGVNETMEKAANP